MNDGKYFRSELLAILLTSVVLLGLLWVAHWLNFIVINFRELMIYSVLTIIAGMIVFAIRWIFVFEAHKKRRRR
jgi:hypothetical protein